MDTFGKPAPYAMDPNLISLCKGLSVPDTFVDLLIKYGVRTTDDFALLASTEAEIKTEIFPMAKSGGVELTEIAHQLAVKKLWVASRKAFTGPDAPGSSVGAQTVIEDEGIPKETNGDLLATWKDKHGFTLPESWLLTAPLQKRIWKAALAIPLEVEVILMEQLRMLSQRTRISGALLNQLGPRTARVELDVITAPMEVAYRARAFLMTNAYVCIRRRDWMDLQCAIFAADRIQDLALATSGGTLPPVDHVVDAWTATIHYFSEQVRINNCKLKDAIMNTGGWENKWHWTNTNRAAPDVPRNIAMDAANIRELARQQQSANDRARALERSAALAATGGAPPRRSNDGQDNRHRGGQRGGQHAGQHGGQTGERGCKTFKGGKGKGRIRGDKGRDRERSRGSDRGGGDRWE